MLPDEKNPLRLLDHSGNPMEFVGRKDLILTSLIMSLDGGIKPVKATLSPVFSWCWPLIVSITQTFNYTMAGPCVDLTLLYQH